VKILPRLTPLSMSLKSQLVNVDSCPNEAARGLDLSLLDHGVKHGPEPAGVGCRAADFADLPHRDLCLDPGLPILKIHADREGTHFIIPRVVLLGIVEKLTRCRAQELQFGAAEDVVNDILSVANVVVMFT